MLRAITILNILFTGFAAMAANETAGSQVNSDASKLEIACSVMFDAVGNFETITLQKIKYSLNSFEGSAHFLNPQNPKVKKTVLVSVDSISKEIAIGMTTKGLSLSSEGVGSTRLNVINEKVPSDTFAIECKL